LKNLHAKTENSAADITRRKMAENDRERKKTTICIIGVYDINYRCNIRRANDDGKEMNQIIKKNQT
jgi:hypothetical protein